MTAPSAGRIPYLSSDTHQSESTETIKRPDHRPLLHRIPLCLISTSDSAKFPPPGRFISHFRLLHPLPLRPAQTIAMHIRSGSSSAADRRRSLSGVLLNDAPGTPRLVSHHQVNILTLYTVNDKIIAGPFGFLCHNVRIYQMIKVLPFILSDGVLLREPIIPPDSEINKQF